MFRQEQTVNVYIDGQRYTSSAPPQQRGSYGHGQAIAASFLMMLTLVATAPLWAPVWLVWRFRSELVTAGYYLTVWPVEYFFRLVAEEVQYRRQLQLEERRRPVVIVVNNHKQALEAVKQHRLEAVQPDSVRVIEANQFQRKAAKLHG
jgi:hypothetical protein